MPYKTFFLFLFPIVLGAQIKDTVTLREVVVTPQTPYFAKDTLIIPIDSTAVRKGASIGEMLKTLPGVIFENGKLFIQGKEVQTITINGKEIYGGNSQMAMEILPARWAEKLKIGGLRAIDSGSNGPLTMNISTHDPDATKWANQLETLLGASNLRYRAGMNSLALGKTEVWNALIEMNNVQKDIIPAEIFKNNTSALLTFSKGDLWNNIRLFSDKTVNNPVKMTINNEDTTGYVNNYGIENQKLQSAMNYTYKTDENDYNSYLLFHGENGILENKQIRNLILWNASLSEQTTQNEPYKHRFLAWNQRYNSTWEQGGAYVTSNVRWNERSVNTEYNDTRNIGSFGQSKTQWNGMQNATNKTLNLQGIVYGSTTNFKWNVFGKIDYKNSIEALNFDNQIALPIGVKKTTGTRLDDFQTVVTESFFGFSNKIEKHSLFDLRFTNRMETTWLNRTMQTSIPISENNLTGFKNQENLFATEAIIWIKPSLEWSIFLGADFINYNRNRTGFVHHSNSWLYPKAMVRYQTEKSYSIEIRHQMDTNFENINHALPVQDSTRLHKIFLGNPFISSPILYSRTALSVNLLPWVFTFSHAYSSNPNQMDQTIGILGTTSQYISAFNPKQEYNATLLYVTLKGFVSFFSFDYKQIPMSINNQNILLYQSFLTALHSYKFKFFENVNWKLTSFQYFIFKPSFTYNLSLISDINFSLAKDLFFDISYRQNMSYQQFAYWNNPNININVNYNLDDCGVYIGVQNILNTDSLRRHSMNNLYLLENITLQLPRYCYLQVKYNF